MFISSGFFTFFFFSEIATESWRRGCWRWERKQGLFISWVAISKAWHGDSDTGNNLKGACGLLPSFQGGFRCDDDKGKRDRPSPTQQLLDINTNIARAQPGTGCSSASLPHLATWDIVPVSALSNTLKNAFHRRLKPNPNAAACPNPEQTTAERLRWSREKFARNARGW